MNALSGYLYGSVGDPERPLSGAQVHALFLRDTNTLQSANAPAARANTFQSAAVPVFGDLPLLEDARLGEPVAEEAVPSGLTFTATATGERESK